jgi:enterochelin esterase-like enzyme
LIRFIAVLAALASTSACGAGPSAGSGDAEITFEIVVPAGTQTIYLTGSTPSLGPWKPDARALDCADRQCAGRLTLPIGTELEYKFTLGSWDREAVDENGFPYPNFTLTAEDGMVVTHELPGFKPEQDALLDDWRGSGVEGTLVYWRDVESAFLEPTRHVEIWLPPGYDDPANAAQRYPVIYMTDGENLFDPRIANTGVDWGVDEAMMRGVQSGAYDPAIVVGHWSTRRRGQEYSPWHDGPQTARFVIEELKPRIDREFRTRPGRDDTFAMGSSMGGLFAMHLVTSHPDVFSACGCVSTHLPLSEAVVAQYWDQGSDGPHDEVPYADRMMEAGALRIPTGTRLFFDYGTETLDAEYPAPHARLRRYLTEKGYVDGTDFLIREYPGAAHNEAAWRARVGDQLHWLLAGEVPPIAGD